MRRLFCCLAVAVMAFSGVRAGEVPVKGEVREVTVYTSGSARVTRRAKVEVPVGKAVFVSLPLPATADISSVQVSLPGAKVESVETRRELPDEKALESKQAIHRKKMEAQEDKLFKLDQERKSLIDQIEAQEETLSFLKKMREQATQTVGREMAVQQLNVESWSSAIEMSKAKATDARKEILRLRALIRSADKTLGDERRVYSEISREMPKSVYENRVYITVLSARKLTGEMVLSYNVNGATWEPSYRASADIPGKKVDFEIFGTISQNSGEDWKEVALSLSTARPDIGTDAPILKPWYIRTGQPAPVPTLSKIPMGGRLFAESAASSVQSGLDMRQEEALEQPSTAVSGGAATVFMAEAKANIPSDGFRHRIPVRTISTPVEIEHVAIPKILQYAFIRAKAVNKAPFPILPGVVEVVVGGSYVGRGMVKLTSPGEPLLLSLGIDESIKVEYKLLNDRVERKRRGDKVSTTNVFRITAKNYGKDTVNLSIIDQLPISASSQVTVDYGREASRALRGAEFPGQLQWLAKLEPGKDAVIEFDFSIEYPEYMKRQLQEGNRKMRYTQNFIQEKQNKQGFNDFDQAAQEMEVDNQWKF